MRIVPTAIEARGVERGTSEICSWQELGWRSSSRINVLTPKEAELLGESWNSYREDDAHFYQTHFPNCSMQDTSGWSGQPKHILASPLPYVVAPTSRFSPFIVTPQIYIYTVPHTHTHIHIYIYLDRSSVATLKCTIEEKKDPIKNAILTIDWW